MQKIGYKCSLKLILEKILLELDLKITKVELYKKSPPSLLLEN